MKRLSGTHFDHILNVMPRDLVTFIGRTIGRPPNFPELWTHSLRKMVMHLEALAAQSDGRVDTLTMT